MDEWRYTWQPGYRVAREPGSNHARHECSGRLVVDQRWTVSVYHPTSFHAGDDNEYEFSERHAECERNIEHAVSLHERRSAQRCWNDHRAWRHRGSERRWHGRSWNG